VKSRRAGPPNQPWSDPLPAGGRDASGWITVALDQGRWEVSLNYTPQQ